MSRINYDKFYNTRKIYNDYHEEYDEEYEREGMENYDEYEYDEEYYN